MLHARPATADELDAVAALWIRSWKHSRSEHAGPIPNHLFYEAYRPAVNYFLSRSWCVVVIEDSVPDVFLGFAVVESGFDHPVVHYTYTKPKYRGNGVARLALRAAGVSLDEPFFYTFHTAACERESPGIYRRGIACAKKEQRHEQRNEARPS